MDTDLRKLISDYLNEQKLMQLATISDDGLWACSVWQAPDDNLNIYFFSATTRKHSQDIEKDSRVTGALAKPHEVSDPPQGLQFRGTAELLTDINDIAKARSAYEGHIFDSETIDKLIANPDRPHRFYKITPTKFVLFDAVNFPDNSRQELVL